MLKMQRIAWMVLLTGAVTRGQVVDAPDMPGVGVKAGEVAASRLGLTWGLPEHASGILHPSDETKLQITAANSSDGPLVLHGEVTLTMAGASSPAARQVLTETTLKAGEKAVVTLPLHLKEPGVYTVAVDGRAVESADHLPLLCIFAPRGEVEASVLIAPLPVGVLTPGYLVDFVAQTHCRRFVLDVPWSLVQAGEKGAPLSAALAGLIKAAVAGAKAEIILRLGLGVDSTGTPEAIGALHRYLDGLLPALGPAGVVVVPETEAVGEDAVYRYRGAYLAVYDAAKKADPKMLMLGAGSVRMTAGLLLHKEGAREMIDLSAYVDALGVADDARDVVAGQSLGLKKPVYVLPGGAGAGLTTAVGFAEGLAAVPLRLETLGVPLHLLGGAVVYQKVTGMPVYLAAFQADGYAVGLVAPPMAGAAEKEKLPGTMTISDSEGLMKVVDERGRAVDCRQGDSLVLPLERMPLYLLQSGSADDLAATLRTGRFGEGK